MTSFKGNIMERSDFVIYGVREKDESSRHFRWIREGEIRKNREQKRRTLGDLPGIVA